MSRLRSAPPRLATSRFRRPPLHAGGAAGAARGQRPLAEAGGRSGGGKGRLNFLSISKGCPALGQFREIFHTLPAASLFLHMPGFYDVLVRHALEVIIPIDRR